MEQPRLVLGSAVFWGPQKMPAIVLQVSETRVELAYRRRRELKTGLTAIGNVTACDMTPEHRRIAKEVSPRLQRGLFD